MATGTPTSRAIALELHQDAPAGDDAVTVRVDCVPEGVVLEVRIPNNPRRYRYALDWRAQPEDARPRLFGLAVAEAVEASRLELVAVSEPAPAPPPQVVAIVRERSPWAIAVEGEHRMFSSHAGIDLDGLGAMPSYAIGERLRVTTELVVETGTSLTPSGAVRAVSVSLAPGIAYRIGGRVHGEIGAGARIGLVHLRGEALPDSMRVGTSQVRAWLGPAAMVGIGAAITSTIAIGARLEVGWVASGATARDLGMPVAVIGGGWLSLGLAATIAL